MTGTLGRLAILLGVLASSASLAQTTEGPGVDLTIFGGTGFGGEFVTDSDIEIPIKDGSTFGVIIDFEYDDETQWEIFLLEQDAASDTSDLPGFGPTVDTDIISLQGGGTYLTGGDKVRPFVAGTLGLTHVDPRGVNTNSDTFWSLSVGGGVQIALSERVGVRVEGRVLGMLVDSDSLIYCGTGSGGSQCLFKLQGRIVTQSHAFAGITFRFR